MKKAFLFIWFLVISLHLYNAVGNNFENSINDNSTEFKLENSKSVSYFSKDLSNKFLNAVEIENVISSSNYNPNSSSRIFYDNFAAFSEVVEQIFSNSFSSYISLSLNFFLQNHSTDIIFPFHYFW